MAHLPTHPRITDPRTGEPLRAIGLTSRGPVWPVMGGDGTGDPAPVADPAPVSPAPPAPAPAPTAVPAASLAKADDFKSEHSKEAVLFDLKTVKDENKTLKEQFSRLAAALGVPTQGKGKTDIEALAERVAAQEQRAAAAEMRALRAEVAQEAKLPAVLAARLVGTTREELMADAAALLALIPTGEKPVDGAPGETPVEPPKPNSPAPDPTQGAKGAPLAARPSSLFDAISKASAKT